MKEASFKLLNEVGGPTDTDQDTIGVVYKLKRNNLETINSHATFKNEM